MTKFEDAVVVWRGIKCLSSGMAAVWSAVSAVIFFKMRILTVIGELTGRTAGKALYAAQKKDTEKVQKQICVESDTGFLFSVERSLMIIHTDEVI